MPPTLPIIILSLFNSTAGRRLFLGDAICLSCASCFQFPLKRSINFLISLHPLLNGLYLGLDFYKSYFHCFRHAVLFSTRVVTIATSECQLLLLCDPLFLSYLVRLRISSSITVTATPAFLGHFINSFLNSFPEAGDVCVSDLNVVSGRMRVCTSLSGQPPSGGMEQRETEIGGGRGTRAPDSRKNERWGHSAPAPP